MHSISPEGAQIPKTNRGDRRSAQGTLDVFCNHHIITISRNGTETSGDVGLHSNIVVSKSPAFLLRSSRTIAPFARFSLLWRRLLVYRSQER